jgi:hypothetical protein
MATEENTELIDFHNAEEDEIMTVKTAEFFCHFCFI